MNINNYIGYVEANILGQDYSEAHVSEHGVVSSIVPTNLPAPKQADFALGLVLLATLQMVVWLFILAAFYLYWVDIKSAPHLTDESNEHQITNHMNVHSHNYSLYQNHHYNNKHHTSSLAPSGSFSSLKVGGEDVFLFWKDFFGRMMGFAYSFVKGSQRVKL